jgi:hypothetical protein
MKLLAELKRRNVLRMAALYPVGAWLVVLTAGAAWAGEKPQTAGYAAQLEEAYGPASQQGFGSAVFHEGLRPSDELAAAALAKYRYFVGPLWDRFGEQAWMGPWREVYSRPSGARRDILAELRAIEDPEAKNSVTLLLDAAENAEAARAALGIAFDDSAVTELRVFNLGDGAAMSGLLVAGRRASGGDTTFVVVLMD